VIWGKGAGCDWAPCFFPSSKFEAARASHAQELQELAQRFKRKRECEQRLGERAYVVVRGTALFF